MKSLSLFVSLAGCAAALMLSGCRQAPAAGAAAGAPGTGYTITDRGGAVALARVDRNAAPSFRFYPVTDSAGHVVGGMLDRKRLVRSDETVLVENAAGRFDEIGFADLVQDGEAYTAYTGDRRIGVFTGAKLASASAGSEEGYGDDETGEPLALSFVRDGRTADDELLGTMAVASAAPWDLLPRAPRRGVKPPVPLPLAADDVRETLSAVDLDGDGTDEYLVVFSSRASRDVEAGQPEGDAPAAGAGEGAAVFRKVNGAYARIPLCRSDAEGYSVGSVDAFDVNGDGVMEVFVSENMPDTSGLRVYTVRQGEAVPLLEFRYGAA